MIPDTYCSSEGPEFGYQCPEGMVCKKLYLDKKDRGFNGFDEIGKFDWSILFLGTFSSNERS